jgi:hypothetical protein
VAVRNPARIALFLDLLKASIVGRKIAVEIVEGVAKLGWDGLAAIHGRNSMPSIRLAVKG